MIDVAIALVPVVVFLAALFLMDTFRLVRPSWIVAALAYGALAAFASGALNDWLGQPGRVSPVVLSRYIAPVTEESVKALLLIAMVATARVGFLVDAAVLGFAVGAGFALVENLEYLGSLKDVNATVWFVRGLGTAVLQGATTSILAMIAKTGADRPRGGFVPACLIGWAAAVGIHSLFNHRILPPVAQTLVLLVTLPLALLSVFERSERATREWVGAGLDLDVELLALIGSEHFAATHFGRYLQRLRERLPGTVVADMFCLLRLELELSVQAKAMLLAREAGMDVPADEDLAASLAEREYLERSIGRAGLLALQPLQVTGRRDRWHRHVLGQRRATGATGSTSGS
jgi:protease PrsW